MILLVVLYGTLTLKEEHRLRLSENRVLRRTSETKRDEVTGGCRKTDDEELHDLYFSPNTPRIIKSNTMRLVGHVVRIGDMRNENKVLVEKPDWKTQLGKD
jgi:hypothetical protein